MSILETYSKRKKRLTQDGQPQLHQYDTLPKEFRVQVVHIWRSAIGHRTEDMHGFRYTGTIVWPLVANHLAREYGVFQIGLGARNGSNEPYGQCVEHLLNAPTDDALDIIELSFRVIDRVVRDLSAKGFDGSDQDADDAIAELNHRLGEHGIGYKYMDGEVIRVDSEYIQHEAVEPALTLLYEAEFSGAAEEFMNAHEHFRHGRNKEAIADAGKAFESTLKVICAKRGWAVSPGANASKLIEAVMDNGLIPSSLQSHMGSLRSALASGLPTLRNGLASHGQGAAPQVAEDHVTAFALHLAASNIVLLVQAHKTMPV